MPISAEFQWVVNCLGCPEEAELTKLLHDCFNQENGTILVRLVDEEEGAELNQQYRGKNGATNVLSFPFEVPAGIPNEHLGDIVICIPIVQAEAVAQSKSFAYHFIHMLIHGVLHLLGYDHIDKKDAKTMEAIEVKMLQKSGIPNPYNRD